MPNTIDNTSALKDFVKEFGLMDKYSRVHFKAWVFFVVKAREAQFETMVRIVHDGYDNAGEVIVECPDIDPYQFPEKFDAKYGKFSFLPGKGLRIEDVHHANPNIGDYRVMIIPL